jgi:hypothetical protein
MSPGRTTGEWWARQDLNLGPTDYESAALTAELQARELILHDFVNSVAAQTVHKAG